jgi:hypothetical protein
MGMGKWRTADEMGDYCLENGNTAEPLIKKFLSSFLYIPTLSALCMRAMCH